MKLQEGKFEQAKDSVITGLTPLCGSESAKEAMATARETMSVCRQTLSSTYAFAYFLEPSSQQVIFEQNQEDLETHLGELQFSICLWRKFLTCPLQSS